MLKYLETYIEFAMIGRVVVVPLNMFFRDGFSEAEVDKCLQRIVM